MDLELSEIRFSELKITGFSQSRKFRNSSNIDVPNFLYSNDPLQLKHTSQQSRTGKSAGKSIFPILNHFSDVSSLTFYLTIVFFSQAAIVFSSPDLQDLDKNNSKNKANILICEYIHMPSIYHICPIQIWT